MRNRKVCILLVFLFGYSAIHAQIRVGANLSVRSSFSNTYFSIGPNASANMSVDQRATCAINGDLELYASYTAGSTRYLIGIGTYSADQKVRIPNYYFGSNPPKLYVRNRFLSIPLSLERLIIRKNGIRAYVSLNVSLLNGSGLPKFSNKIGQFSTIDYPGPVQYNLSRDYSAGGTMHLIYGFGFTFEYAISSNVSFVTGIRTNSGISTLTSSILTLKNGSGLDNASVATLSTGQTIALNLGVSVGFTKRVILKNDR